MQFMMGNQVAVCVHNVHWSCQAGPAQVSPTWLRSSILAASTLASASLQAAPFGNEAAAVASQHEPSGAPQPMGHGQGTP